MTGIRYLGAYRSFTSARTRGWTEKAKLHQGRRITWRLILAMTLAMVGCSKPESPAPEMAGPIAQKTTDRCNCHRMVIQQRSGSNSRVYCAPKSSGPKSPFCQSLATVPLDAGCSADEVAYRCPLGPLAPRGGTNPIDRVGFGFEVQAFLVADGSDPDDCMEGQLAQSTIIIDGTGGTSEAAATPTADVTLPTNGGSVTFPVVSRPRNYPFVNDREWGADNYTGENDAKRHDPVSPTQPAISWVDVPSNSTKNDDGSDRNKINDISRFVAYVGRVTDDYCWCEFTVEQFWDRTNGSRGLGLYEVPNTGLRCRIGRP